MGICLDLNPCCKVWLESEDNKFVLGEGTARLLQAIKKEGSLSGAASQLDISYAHAWRKIRDIEKNFGKKVVERKRGGKKGGSSVLTEDGEYLLQVYETFKNKVDTVLKEWILDIRQ
ncbi:MAG: LysR family transcriptional regulator [Candidatus Methanofastidiosia archaeon]|jgi:molybdate transport system regulatory protein